MHFEIRCEFPNQQYLQIQATFDVQETPVEIQFPRWRPGRYELGNFAKNVRRFEVFDQHGNRLATEKTDTHVWSVTDLKTSQITVHYEYYAADLNAGSTFLSDSMLYVNPVNCLAYLRGKENEPCTLQVRLHRPMPYAGTLPESHGKISAESYHDLVDSPFVYSEDIQSAHYEYRDTRFTISFIGLQNVPWEKVLNDFQKFTQAQFDDFGHFPSKTFHFINIITPYAHYHGVEHRASTMIVLGPSYKIFGEYYDELLGISSHELYHVWNVKSIRSADLWPYDYSRENLSKMGYLCEGITTYLGDHYLMTSGIWSPEKYLKEWEQVFQKHLDNFGRFNASLAESSFDTWLDGYVPGAPGRKTSIYNEGALFAFITDIFMRIKTENKRSIADLMHNLYERYFLKNSGISEENFILEVEEIVGKNKYRELFDKLIYQRKGFETDIIECLNLLGLNLSLDLNANPVEALWGVKTIPENGAAKVTQIAPNSTGDSAGLMLGDKILALNNNIIQNDLEAWLKHTPQSTHDVIVNRNGKIVQLQIAVSDARFFPQARIKKMKTTTEEHQKRFDFWSGKKEEMPA